VFALTAVVTLALGIAITTTVFSVVDAELWRRLPYPQPDRLVEVRSHAAARTDTDAISIDELLAWRRAPGLASLAASTEGRRSTLQLDHAESLTVAGVTANYYTTLRRPALLGRVFGDADANNSSTVMLTERGWTRIFDRDPAVVGRTVTLDSQPTVIIGVAADDESLGFNPDAYVPIDERQSSARAQVVYGAVGRLSDGATAEAVRAQVQTILTQRSSVDADGRDHLADVADLSSYYSMRDARRLYFFLAASTLVLLLTIVNIAGLVLARVLRRAPEFALRGALGGGSTAITMQLVVEAALIVVPGCALGLWLTAQALGFVGTVVPSNFLGRGSHIPLDLRVVGVCAAVALLTIGSLALVPLRLARRVGGAAAIGSGSRTGAEPAASRMRHILLTAQLAVTVVLLAGTGIFVESFVALLHVPLGFDPSSAWSASIGVNGPRYATDDARRAYADALIDRARAIPGVRFAGIGTSSPLMSGWLARVRDSRKPVSPAGDLSTIYRTIGGDYFGAVGTPIVRGRGLGPADTASAPAVAVVNEQCVKLLFPDEDPIGKTIVVSVARGAPVGGGVLTIVGVASNIKELSPNETEFSDVYLPFAQHPAPDFELIVRATSDASMAKALRAAAAATDPTMPVTSVTPLATRVTKSMKGARFNLILVTAFAIAALVVAAIGIYGALAYAASARSREYGVRLALGATPRGLVSQALWHAARLGFVGGAVGIAGTLLFAAWLGDALYLVPGQHNGLLFNTRTTDPIALASALAGVVLVALLAGAMPARRVSKIDPVTALRSE
jgi:predicted permease